MLAYAGPTASVYSRHRRIFMCVIIIFIDVYLFRRSSPGHLADLWYQFCRGLGIPCHRLGVSGSLQGHHQDLKLTGG